MVPTARILGASSDTFLAAAAQRVARELNSAAALESPDTTCFLPVEQLERMAETVCGCYSRAEDA